MPRKPKWPPVPYSHPNGQDRVRIYEDGRPRDVWLGPTGSEQARAAYARLIAEMTAHGGKLPPRSPAPEQIIVDQVSARWLSEEGPRHGQTKELAQYRRGLLVLVRLYGPTPAADFGVDELDAVRMAMASGSWLTEAEREAILHPPKSSPEKPPGSAVLDWSRTTVNRMVVRIRTVWRWAERKKLVPQGRWEHLRTLKRLSRTDKRVRQTVPRTSCTEEELRAVLDECRPQARAMLQLQWLCGMRSQEVRLLRPCDLDTSQDVWLYRPRDKTAHIDDGYTRVVTLGPEAQAVLLPWLKKCSKPEAYVFRPRTAARRHDHYTASSYAQLISRACQRAGVKVQPYQARHAFRLRVTRAAGTDAARAAMGHRSIQTTMGYHAEVDVETARDVARKLG